jgi:hypothetical protein
VDNCGSIAGGSHSSGKRYARNPDKKLHATRRFRRMIDGSETETSLGIKES